MAEPAPPLLGDCRAMMRLRRHIPTVARARRTTLISGPTGTGKEVVAHHLHSRSASPEAPFVPVHCGALPDQLFESELFGHTRGAFTGAMEERPGLVRSAREGTLLLDEVDALSLRAQAKLLRFLESGELRPVGSDRPERVHVWVMAATNRSLKEEVAAGRFREDLLYRMNVLHLSLPPLRQREDDIELLARHFLEDLGGPDLRFTPCALAAMRAHDWPGNVRELKHRVERAVLLAGSPCIDAEDLELTLGVPPREDAPVEDVGLTALWRLIEDEGLSLAEAVERCERTLIDAALQAEQNNRTRAAQRLGIHVRTIFKKLRS